jgi:hypothetical protein
MFPQEISCNPGTVAVYVTFKNKLRHISSVGPIFLDAGGLFSCKFNILEERWQGIVGT